MKLTSAQRAKIIRNLTTNCSCMKKPGSRTFLANMDDEELLDMEEKMLKDEEEEKKDEEEEEEEDEDKKMAVIANAAVEGFTDDKAGVAYRLNPMTGAWERKVLAANVRGPRRQPTTNAPPWLKDEEDEDEDVGSTEAIEEEITEEDTPPKKTKCEMLNNNTRGRGRKSTTRVTNSTPVRKMSLKKMLQQHGTPEERAVWNHAVATWEAQKMAMVDRIVANHRELRDEDVEARRSTPIYNKLMQRSADELQEMLDLIPTANSEPPVSVPMGASYIGAAGAPVANRYTNHDADDTLVPPRIEWETISRAGDNGRG